jgi:regulatory protein
VRRHAHLTSERPDDPDEAERAALRILGAAAQSGAGLRRRLLQRGYAATTVDEAVRRCRERGYIDDRALADSVAARHRRSHHGRARIAADLRARGVDAESVADAVAGLEGDEQETALAAARHLVARNAHGSLQDQAVRRRIGAALQRRGFSGEIIVKALRTLSSESAGIDSR